MNRINQPPLLRRLSIQWLATHHPLQGTSAANGAWHKPGAAGIGDQPQFDKGLYEAGRTACQNDVASQSNAATGAGGNAIDGSNDRFFHAAHQADDGVIGLMQGGSKVGGLLLIV